MTEPVLTVDGLRTHFFTKAGVVKAVDDVSFTVGRGEVLGLVGESGSGKSMTGYSLMGLIDPPGRIVDGQHRPRRRRPARAVAGRAAPHARQPHRDDLPGSDDDAEPGPAHRRADDRGDPRARPGEPGDRARAGARGAGQGRHPVAGRAAPGVSAPVLRRHAPARRDRDRAAQQSRPHHRGRADDGARRHDPGPDPLRDAEAHARDRHGAHLDHARPVGDRRTRRPRVRDVRRTHRRAGDMRGRARRARASVHAGTARFGACQQRARPAG